LQYDFSGKPSSRLRSLFTEHHKNNTNISFADLSHIKAVDTNEIHVAKKDDYREHIAHVDKATTNSNVNYDGTNVTVRTNLGVANLVNGAINSASHPSGGSYAGQFTVENNGTLVVTAFQTLPIGEHRLLIQELAATFTIVQYIVTEGSKELTTTPQKKSGLSLVTAQSYLDGSKTFAEISASLEVPPIMGDVPNTTIANG